MTFDRGEFDRWQTEAGRALQAARVQAGAGLHNWACFAAEQAAQLAVKGLLHGLGAGPWGHDLVRLGEEVAEQAPGAWSPGLAPLLRELSRHYIPARYPDAHPEGPAGEHYGPEDSSRAIEAAEEIVAAMSRIWRHLDDGDG